MNDLIARDLRPSEWEDWDRWLESGPWGAPFASAWWLDATCRAFGGHPVILCVLQEEKILGGIALRMTDVGPMHIVRPSLVYNPIVMDQGSWQHRKQALELLLIQLESRWLTVPPITLTPDMVDLRIATWRHWQLTAGWTALTQLNQWSVETDVSRTELQQLRKAQREGLEASVEPADPNLLFGLMETAMRRHGLVMRPTENQLEMLVRAAGTHGMQVVVRDANGLPISSGFIMTQSATSAYYVWAGTSTAGLAQGAAVLRDIYILKELQARGCKRIDWCGASIQGVSDFKLKLGSSLAVRLAIAREPWWCRRLRRHRIVSLRVPGRPKRSSE